jgi:cytoplasmic iron level regulating protein YaaA (DUF328/UPF0246 family)
VLREKSPADIAKLMDISDALATLNVGRYHDWNPVFTPDNAKQAVLAFMGDVYEGLDAASLNEASWTTCNTICAFCPACTACCGRWT